MFQDDPSQIGDFYTRKMNNLKKNERRDFVVKNYFWFENCLYTTADISAVLRKLSVNTQVLIDNIIFEESDKILYSDIICVL